MEAIGVQAPLSAWSAQHPALWTCLVAATPRNPARRIASGSIMLFAFTKAMASPDDAAEIFELALAALEQVAEAEAEAGSERGRLPRILAFFAQERDDKLNVHDEAQALQLLQSLCDEFEVPNINSQPTFPDFLDMSMCTSLQNVTVVHLAGHCETADGFYFMSDSKGLSSEAVEASIIARAAGPQSVAQGGTIQCVVLNASRTTVALGRLMREQGVERVVCWDGTVPDDVAARLWCPERALRWPLLTRAMPPPASASALPSPSPTSSQSTQSSRQVSAPLPACARAMPTPRPH